MDEDQRDEAGAVADELEDDLEVQSDEAERVMGGTAPRDAATGLPTGQR